MDAWEALLVNSSLTVGDTWEHLNNQEGGGTSQIIFVDTLEVELETSSIEVEIPSSSIEVEIVDNSVQIELDNTDIEIEVYNG